MIYSIARCFQKTRLWAWFSRTLIAHLNLRIWGYTTFPMERFFDIVDLIAASEREAPGLYCFVSCDPGSFGGRLIKTFTRSAVSHGGIFTPGTEFLGYKAAQITHMMSPGILQWHPLSLYRQNDLIAVCKYEFEDEWVREVVVQRMNAFLEKRVPYDTQLDLESIDKVYCSEFIYQLLKGLNYKDKDGNVITIKSRRRYDRQVFEPADITRCATKILWSNYEIPKEEAP